MSAQGPKEVVVDAYEEHVRALRERETHEKIATLVIPETELISVARVIAEAIDTVEGLSLAQRKKWESILRKLMRAIHEAE